MATLPGHVTALPVWISYLAAVAVLLPMAAVALTKGNTLWLGIERTVIILLAITYVANTIAELADMIGVITLYSSGNNAFSLLSSSVAIWVVNVLMFSLLYIKKDLAMISSGNIDWPQLIADGERLGIRIEEEEDKARQQQQQQLDREFQGDR